MESGRVMLLHSIVIGGLFFLFFNFILGQSVNVSENKSILIASLVLTYMILFGHGLPTKINKGLFV